MMKTALRLAAGAALIVSLLLMPSTAWSGTDEECDIPATGLLSEADVPEGSDVEACEAVGRVVTDGDGQAIQIPDAGEKVRVDSYGTDGSDSFSVAVSAGGDIDYAEDDAAVGAASTAGAEEQEEYVYVDEAGGRVLKPKGCTQTTVAYLGYKEFDSYNWYLGDGKRPPGHTTDQVVTQLKDAANHIVQGYNDCGYSDTITAKHSYKGITSTESDLKIVNGQSYCGASDGVSTWDFNNVDTGGPGETTVAIECTFSTQGNGTYYDVDTADIRFNTTNFTFSKTGNSGCGGKYDLRSVATHEAGHVFGLRDLSASSATALTMYAKATPCSEFRRTLGRGDVAGLRVLY